MNQERKSKIKLISEMIAIYQTTVLNETDSDNIRLIKQDITNKKMDLEELKQELNSELNTLYDSGANEIDPEVNQLQIIINDVNVPKLQSSADRFKSINNAQTITTRPEIQVII